ncbi:MAG: sensor histidine kinase [Candidatus Binataceae bacterium]
MEIPVDVPGAKSAPVSGDPHSLDLNIARARIALSLLAMLSMWVDPTTPGGLFDLTRTETATLLAHLTYSIVLLVVLSRRVPLGNLSPIPNVLDLFFATVISFFTQGQSGPSNVFFVFAIIAAAIRPGLAPTIAAVVASVALYLIVIAFSVGLTLATMMRPVYLAILGYLIGFVGQQRALFEARVRELETRAQRFTIARSLHDGYVQALAGVNLRLETCRELLARGRVEETLGQLQELQKGVAREYDGVRAYIRSLAGLDEGAGREPSVVVDPRCRVQAAFAGRGLTGEHLLQMMLEGLRNARRHGTARQVEINLSGTDDRILLTIEDDGIGFTEAPTKPWAIASRVAELGGHLTVTSGGGATRLTIEMSE